MASFCRIGWKADLDHLRIESFSSMVKPLLAMIDVASAFVGDGHCKLCPIRDTRDK
jgi:hypothetical protein